MNPDLFTLCSIVYLIYVGGKINYPYVNYLTALFKDMNILETSQMSLQFWCHRNGEVEIVIREWLRMQELDGTNALVWLEFMLKTGGTLVE